MRESGDADLDRYEIKDLVGQGGMGMVFRAHDRRLRRDVALKVMRAESLGVSPTVEEPLPPTLERAMEFPSFSEVSARFQQEAWITARLEHPGIVPVYDMDPRASDARYYTMRLISQGQTLQSRLDEVRSSGLRERLRLLDAFARLCEIVAFAHSESVIHRDIKPANVLLGDYGEVLLLDWGLARLAGEPREKLDDWEDRLARHRERAELETVSSAIGTPGYMAYEVTGAESTVPSAQSDVYSLGVLLYEILTGQLPVPVDSLVEYVQRLASDPAPDPREVEPSVPDALAELCASALRKDPLARPAGALALVMSLQSWKESSVVERELAAARKEAEGLILEAEAADVGTSPGVLDRAALVLERARSYGAAGGWVSRLEARVQALRAHGVSASVKAGRRRLLRQGAAVVLLVALVASLFVAAKLEESRSRAEAAATRAERRSEQFGALSSFVLESVQEDLVARADLSALERLSTGVLTSLGAPGSEEDEQTLSTRANALAIAAAARLRQGDVTGALARSREVIDLLERFASATGAPSVEYGTMLALAHGQLARAHLQAGRLDDAERATAACMRGLQALDATQVADGRGASSIDSSYGLRAHVLRRLDRTEEALRVDESRLRFLEAMMIRLDGDIAVLRSRAAVEEVFAEHALAAGDTEQFARRLRAMERLRRRMIEIDPQSSHSLYATYRVGVLAARGAVRRGAAEEEAHHLAEAAEALRTLQARDPADVDSALGLVLIRCKQSVRLRRAGDLDGARDLLQGAIQLAERVVAGGLGGIPAKDRLALTLSERGNVARSARDFDRAEKSFTRALALRREIAGTSADVQHHFQVANAHDHLALCHLERGAHDAALASTRACLAKLAAEPLAGSNGGNAHQMRLFALARLAKVQMLRGELEDAVDAARETVRMARAAFDDPERRALSLIRFAVFTTDAAAALLRAGEKDEGTQLLVRAKDLLAARHESGAASAMERMHLAYVVSQLANTLPADVASDEKEQLLRLAQTLRLELLESSPQVPQWHVNVAASEVDLAAYLRDRDRLRECIALLTSATIRYKALADKTEMLQAWVSDHAFAHYILGQVLESQGDYEEAVTHMAKADDLAAGLTQFPHGSSAEVWARRRADAKRVVAIQALHERRLAEAEDQLEAAKRLGAQADPADPQVPAMMAGFDTLLGKIQLLAGSQPPQTKDDHALLGQWWLEGKQWDRAAFHFEHAYPTYGNDLPEKFPSVEEVRHRLMRGALAVGRALTEGGVSERRRAQLFALGQQWLMEVTAFSAHALYEEGENLQEEAVRTYADALDGVLQHPELSPLRTGELWAQIKTAATKTLGR